MDDYFDAAGPKLAAGDFSVATWIKTSQTSRAQVIGDFSNNPTTNKGWLIDINHPTIAPGQVFLHAGTGNTQYQQGRSSTLINDGQWHQVVFTKGASGINLFVDGVPDFVQTALTGIPTDVSDVGNVRIGTGTAPSRTVLNYAGLVDQTAIYPRVLTAQEVADLYNSGTGLECPELDLMVVSRGPTGSRDLFVMDSAGGNLRQVTTHPADDYDAVWSPDGSKLAFSSNRDGNYELYTINADGTSPTRLTFDAAMDFDPAWSPDGARIAFRSKRTGDDIWVIGADGTGLTRITTYGGFDGGPHWSWANNKIVFASDRSGLLHDVYTMNPDGSNVTQLTAVPGLDTAPSWSPDGTQIVFVSWRHGQYEVFTMNADGTNQVRLTTSGGEDVTPAWSRDGASIAWSSDVDVDGIGEASVMNVDGSNQTRVTFDAVTTAYPDWRPIAFAPVVAVDAGTTLVTAGALATATGTYSDANGDPVALSASIGSVVDSGAGTWSWSYSTSAVSDSQKVTITADDGQGGVATTSFFLLIDPVAGPLGSSWTEVRVDTNAPYPSDQFPDRAGHHMAAFDGDGDGVEELWVYGGSEIANAGIPHGDLWRSVDGGATWTEIPGIPVPGRSNGGFLVYGDELWIVGGLLDAIGGGRVTTNDVWSSPDGLTWTQVTPAAAFAPRYNLSAAVHDGKMWVIGGNLGTAGGLVAVDDAWWSTDGANWNRATASAGFGGRNSGFVTSFNGRLWMAGGLTEGPPVFKNDVWSSADGTVWTQVTAGAAFAPRANGAFFTHASRMWYIGGTGGVFATGLVDFDDVWWSVDGASWTQATAAAGFPGSGGLRATAIDGQFFISGGVNSDTLEFFNTVWSTGAPLVVNAPPTAGNVAAAGDEDTAISWFPAVTDADGDPLTCSIDTPPAAGVATVASDCGSGTFQPAPDDNGVFGFGYSVTDGIDTASGSVSVSVAAVNDPPAVVAPIGDVGVAEDSAAVVIDLSGVFADADGDPLTLSVSSSDPGLVGSALAGSILTLSFTPDGYGAATVSVEASDGAAAPTTASFAVTVNPVNDPPAVVSPIGDVVAAEDASFVIIDVSGVFADVDGASLTFTSSSSDTSLVGAAITGSSLALSFATNQHGAATVTVIASDEFGASATVSFAVTVDPVNDVPSADAGGPYLVDEGSSVTVDASGSFDVDGDLLDYAWDLDNDGTFETPGVSVAYAAGNGPSTAQVVVQVCDSVGACDTATAVAVVTNVAPSMVSVSNNGPVPEGFSATIAVVANDPADTLGYSFDCDGDGVFEIGPQTAVSAACAFDDDGAYSIAVSVDDGDGGTATGTSAVTVTNVAPTGSFDNATGPILEGGAAMITFSSQFDPSVADTAFGFTYSYDCTGDGLFETVSSATASFACSYPDDGTFTAIGRITDKDAGFSDVSTTIVVTNAAPTVASIVAPAEPQVIGTALSFVGTYTDAGLSDTHTASWDWGDGSISTGTVDAVTRTVADDHVYATPGVYTVTLTVTDDGGATAVELYQYVVAYDPAGKKVIGSGEWDVGEDAEFEFGFRVKVKNDGSLRGEFEFEDELSGLEMESSVIDSMLIFTDWAQIRGSGTIEDGPAVEWLATMVDGKLSDPRGEDAIRIKVWKAGLPALVLVDLQPGAGDFDRPTTLVDHGKVKIKKS